jgi:glyoxylate/hydroxypyruvate reductase
MAILIQIGEFHSQEIWRDGFLAVDPNLDLRLWPDIGDPADIEAVIVWHHVHGSLMQFPNLKIICNLGAGVEAIFKDPDLPPGVPIARVVDPRLTRSMAEYVVLHVLRYHRHFAATQDFQTRKQWRYIPPDDAAATTIGFLGVGELGQFAAHKVRAMGFQVAGWSRSAKSIDGMTTYHGPDQLAAFLGSLKMLVCLLPLTAETTGIVNAELLSLLPDDSYFINAGRGQQVVDDDLLAALDSAKLSGATLDVFNVEPLPEEHAYWHHPKVTITPHNAADSFPEDVCPQILSNIKGVLTGSPALNEVKVGRGY